MSERVSVWDYLFVSLFVLSLGLTAFLMDTSIPKFCFCLENGHCATSKNAAYGESENIVYDFEGSFLELRSSLEQSSDKSKRVCDFYRGFDPELTEVLFERDFFIVYGFNSEPQCYCLNDGRCVLALRDVKVDLVEFFEAVNKSDAIERIPEFVCEDLDRFVSGRTRIFYEGGSFD